MRLLRKKLPTYQSLPGNRRFWPKPKFSKDRAEARDKRNQALKKWTGWLLTLLWIAGLALCLIRRITGLAITEAFWRAPFQFTGFNQLWHIIATDVQNVFHTVKEGRFLWPPAFELLRQLFSVQDHSWPYTLSFLILCGVWMLRVIRRRQIREDAAIVPPLLELLAIMILLAAAQNINSLSSIASFWKPLWAMAQVAALGLPFTALIEGIALGIRKRKMKASWLIAGLIAESLLAFIGFCLCI